MKNKHKSYSIPFNKPHLVGDELQYIRHAHKLRQLAGNGFYTKQAQKWIEQTLGSPMSLLTHSATAAIEMMAILSRIEPGDEIIMPNYTFVSTANAFVLRRAVPVFVDIRPDTLNINEQLIEKAITKKTKAIVPVHYAGVGCEMDSIRKLAKKHKLLVLEDAAQGFLATYKNQHLGTIGDMSAFSFHETKNIISGEGGALLVNNKKFFERAKIVWEKGTNRSKYFLGLVDKYTWVDVGSSYLPGEITSAFLMAQLEKAVQINKKRMMLWDRYHKQLKELEDRGYLRRPIIPDEVKHNAHLYYILTKNAEHRVGLMNFLKKRDILAVTHYVPLNSSPGGRRFCRTSGAMTVTNMVSDTLIRLPLFYDLKYREQSEVLQAIYDYYKHV
jgi:dTDP-4-amino-4,6-dideoxygalactose transaminase